MCDEDILDGQRGHVMPCIDSTGSTMAAVHAECLLASVVGHDIGHCACDGRPMTYARACDAWNEMERRSKRWLN